EKLEQEKLEQEKLEQEKLEQEKLEQEKLEQEKSEQEKLEQEKLEQEKIEQEKLEQEKSLEDDKTIGSLEPLQELKDEIEFSLDSLEILDSLDESETSESLEPLVSLDSLDALDALDLNDSQESLDSLDPLFGLGNATEPLSESDDSTEPILEHEENTKADIEEEQMLADKLLNKDLAETVEEIEDEVESNYETDYLDEAATTIEDYSEQTDSEIDNIDEDADIEEVGINNVERYKFLVEGNDIRALTGTPLDSLFDIKPNIIEEKVIQVREELVNNSLDSYESFDEDNPFSYLWRNRFDHRFTNKQFDFDELEKMCVDDFISSKIDHELMRAIKSIKNIDQLGLIKAVNCGSERLHPDKTTIVINRSIKSNKRVFTSEMLEDMSNEKEISIDYLQKIDYEMIKSEEEYIKKETQLGILLHDLVMEKPQRLIS
ncbi:MAG TPA: hypothetical protein GXZ90_08470, partial [Clostridiales bacterium]|nr:hypothetical protein [Clostridiales bacterium]